MKHADRCKSIEAGNSNNRMKDIEIAKIIGGK